MLYDQINNLNDWNELSKHQFDNIILSRECEDNLILFYAELDIYRKRKSKEDKKYEHLKDKMFNIIFQKCKDKLNDESLIEYYRQRIETHKDEISEESYKYGLKTLNAYNNNLAKLDYINMLFIGTLQDLKLTAIEEQLDCLI